MSDITKNQRGFFMKKKQKLWLESFIQWGIFSRKDIESGKITRADIIKRISQMSTQMKENRLVINLPEWIKKCFRRCFACARIGNSMG